MFRYITRNIWLLSLVSLFTDMASEMLYPVMPVYLKHIGFSVLLIGILEGIAEAVAGLVKVISVDYLIKPESDCHLYKWVMRFQRLSKPMMALFTSIPWIFSATNNRQAGKGNPHWSKGCIA